MLCAALVLSAVLNAAETTPFYPDKQQLLCCIDESGRVVPALTPAEWERRRAHILANMERVMGPLPSGDRSAPPAYETLVEETFPNFVRKSIAYVADPWGKTSAFLFLPRQDSAPSKTPGPAMLCLHPTSPLGKRVVAGEGQTTNRNYAEELANRGYVVLAPDYPGFGDDEEARKQLYEEGYVSCTMKGIWNHLRAVDLLTSLPEVDPERIGCIGHSLGGHNTLFLGVFDPRLRVLATSCGFTAFPRYMGGDLTGWTHDGYMPRIAEVYGKDPAKMPFDFPEVLAALAPRALFINAPIHDDNFDVVGVRESVQAARAVYALYGAEDRLRVTHPDADHDFPDAVREEAYAFIDAALNDN